MIFASEMGVADRIKFPVFMEKSNTKLQNYFQLEASEIRFEKLPNLVNG